MSKAKLLATYALLVGVPLLGLLAILRAGERLRPPQSLGGAWKLEADFTSLANAACRDLLSGVKQPFLTVSQSGPSLAVTLNNAQRTTLAGTVQDTRFEAAAGSPTNIAGASGGCLDPRAIRVQADIAKEAGQRILIGTLSIAGCAECTPIPFRARRLGALQNEGR